MDKESKDDQSDDNLELNNRGEDVNLDEYNIHTNKKQKERAHDFPHMMFMNSG